MCFFPMVSTVLPLLRPSLVHIKMVLLMMVLLKMMLLKMMLLKMMLVMMMLLKMVLLKMVLLKMMLWRWRRLQSRCQDLPDRRTVARRHALCLRYCILAFHGSDSAAGRQQRAP
jgi:hypothetical protein